MPEEVNVNIFKYLLFYDPLIFILENNNRIYIVIDIDVSDFKNISE